MIRTPHRLWLAAVAVAVLLPTGPLRAGETTETILIRKTLEKDRSARRRGDAELLLAAYDEDGFATWNANGSSDGRGWSVLHPDRAAAADAIHADLDRRRYDIMRTVLLIQVWKDLAFATTLDSGQVIDTDGSRQPWRESRLWTLRKANAEAWLITGTVVALGDSAAGPATGRVDADAVAAFLRDEAETWRRGSADDIAGAYAEHAAVVDAYFSSNPAKWVMVFAGQKALETWLSQRLDHVDYDVQRTVVHAVAQGDAAVAVTRDRVAATYAAGDARVTQDRLSTWLLQRRGGTWRVLWVWWKAKPFTGDDATALR